MISTRSNRVLVAQHPGQANTQPQPLYDSRLVTMSNGLAFRLDSSGAAAAPLPNGPRHLSCPDLNQAQAAKVTTESGARRPHAPQPRSPFDSSVATNVPGRKNMVTKATVITEVASRRLEAETSREA